MAKKKPKIKPSKANAAGSKKNNVTSKSDKSAAHHTDIEAIAAAICSANQDVFMKICRLCESKDGPFLDIFDADTFTANKIDELMPFGIAENDDLPHKICFRCSAKVEELYEFIQKCIKTQNNLNTTMGKKEPILMKTKTRTQWREQLDKSNKSNDEICEAIIKKALEGIKDISINPLSLEEEKPVPPIPIKRVLKPRVQSPKPPVEINNKSDEDASLKQLKVVLDACDKKTIPTRSSRLNKSDELLEGLHDIKKNTTTKKQITESPERPKDESSPPSKRTVQISSSSDDEMPIKTDDSRQKVPPSKPKQIPELPKPVEHTKPFNIMDHVSMIKVNGVGVLFQCRLCNRNFLKKDVVATHGCAKTGVPKIDVIKPAAPPEPPKISTVKYINTKIDGELGKPNPVKVDNEKVEVEPQKPSIPEVKPKPRIGPASKVKKTNHNSLIGMTVAPIEDEKEKAPPIEPTVKTVSKSPPVTPIVAPAVQLPAVPSLNSRYKLVPGPNNTFQLVEESNAATAPSPSTEPEITIKKRKSNVEHIEVKKSKQVNEPSHRHRTANNPEVNNLVPPPSVHKKSDEQPYPVGLFQTLPHPSAMFSSGIPTQPGVVNAPAFTTPAMKKQSYTIVQTGNPSKLLISTKPQPPIEEAPKKRPKKNKHDTPITPDQPFNVTLEDAAHPKDHGFFNFINVDPLLQPSYVLPTDNIIQESQISTSSSVLKSALEKDKDKDKYSCNMCGEQFSREKKLLAHIHSHYTKMDEEDMQREKSIKKRRK